jgi:hypothetical protein
MRSKRGNFTKFGRAIFVIFLFSVAVFLTVAETRVVSANPSSPDTKNLIATPSDPPFADDNLVLHLMFNENGGTMAQDASKYMNTGTLYNFGFDENSGWTDGVFGSALRFDGVDDYVGVPHSDSLNVGEELTLEAWVKPFATGFQTVIYKADNGRGYRLMVRDFTLEGDVWDSTGARYFKTGGEVKEGEWSHIVVTWKTGGYFIGYINGDEVWNVSAGANPVGNNTVPIYVGCAFYSGGVRDFFNGTIDEVRIYNRALAADKIEQHYILGSTKRIMGATPQFNWSYYDPDGDKQNAFQIQVGTTENGNSMWDYTSPTTENRWVTYAGAALSRGVTYHVRARVQDNTGAWSENWARTTFKLNQLPIAENQKAENQVNPTNLTTLAPTLSWNYADLDNDAQTQYQIQVGTSENDNSMWDSTVSTSSTSATYAGASLSGGVTYHWRVKVYDGYEWSSWLYGGTFRLSQLPTTPTTTTAPPTTTTTTPTTTTTAPPTTPPTTPSAEAPWAWVSVGIAIGVTIAVIFEVLRLKGKKLPKPMGLRLKGKKLPKPMSIEEIIPFIPIVICAAAAKFIASGIFVLAVFIITLAIYAWRKYDSRMLVGTALFLLVVCAVLLVSGSERYANEVAIWAYYFLVIGVLGLFIEYMREEKRK